MKRQKPPSVRRSIAIANQYKASIEAMEWPSDEVCYAVFNGVLNAAWNKGPDRGLVIPPIAVVWHKGKDSPYELCHVPSNLQGMDLIHHLGELGREHNANRVSFSYIGGETADDPRDIVVTFVVYPDVLWKVQGLLEGTGYTRLSMERHDSVNAVPVSKRLPTPASKAPMTFTPDATIYGAWIAGGSYRDVLLAVWQNGGEELQAMGRVREDRDGSKQCIQMEVTPENLEQVVEKCDVATNELVSSGALGESAFSRCIKNTTTEGLLRWKQSLAAEGIINLRTFCTEDN
jgi:hypothetical protein